MNKTKFLGIVIEEHLNWAMHISHLCNIIARNVGILQKLRYFIPAYVLKILYHSLVLSHLQYCTLLGANSYHSHLHKLRLLQKKAIRIISNTDSLAHSSKLFFNLKLLKLDDIMKFQLGTFMQSQIQDFPKEGAPFVPSAKSTCDSVGGGVVAEIFRRGGPGLQKAGSTRHFALITHFYIFRFSRRGGPGGLLCTN